MLDAQYQDLKEQIREGFKGVNDRLDDLNGRTRKNEQEVAVLKDRSDRAERTAGTIGGVVGAVTGAISSVAKGFLTGS